MNTNTKRLGIYLAILLTATMIATTLRSVACVTELDYASGFFTSKSLITLANAIISITVIGMTSYGFVASRIKLQPSFSTAATYVPTGILGVATVFLGVKLLTYTINSTRYVIFGKNALPFTNPAVFLGILAAILAFVSIAHHFLNAFNTEAKTELRAYFATATVTFFALYAILIYLDGSLSLNESSKILRQTSFLFSALFFLYEVRISLGREMWRIYTVFGLIAAILTAYTSIPAIITYYVNGELLSSIGNKSLASIEEYILLLALFIFIISRLCLTAILSEEKKNELLEALARSAIEREREASESYERYQEAFAAKQLSIFDLYGDGDSTVVDEEPSDVCTENVCEVENKEPMISDDVIYEAIFGKMPERPEENACDETETEDDRDPMEIADQIFSTLDDVLNENTAEENEKESNV